MGHPHFSEDKRCLILADYLEGKSRREIAETHGCSLGYPFSLASREGLSNRGKIGVRRRRRGTGRKKRKNYFRSYYLRNRRKIIARALARHRRLRDDRRRTESAVPEAPADRSLAADRDDDGTGRPGP